MSVTDELRRMLDEHDEYYKTSGNKTWWGRPIDRQTGKPINMFHYQAQPMGEDRLLVELQLATPAQAIAATVWRGTCGKVYLVEVSDDLLEGWYPMAVYLYRESAEDCAEALRKKEDGIWQFARVSELKVVDA